MAAVAIALFGFAWIAAALRPAWAVVLLVVMFVLEQVLQSSLPIFVAIPSLANYLVAAAIGIAALRAVLAEERPFLGYATRVWLLSMAIFAWGVVSLLWTPSTMMATDMTREGLPYLMLFMVAAPILFDGRADLERIFPALMLFGTVVALAVIINPEFNIRSGRIGLMLTEKVRSNPLAIGELGGVLMIVSALFVVPSGRPAWSFTRFAAFVVGTTLALYSGSRGQALFAGAVALAFYPLSRPIRSIRAFAGTVLGLSLLVGLLFLVSSFVLDTELSSRWDASVLAEGTEVRRLNVLDLFVAFARSPGSWLTGLGWNAFSSVTDASSEPYSHSITVDVLCELGIPMFVIFCVILIDVYRGSRSLLAVSAGSPGARSASATLVALVTYLFLIANKQGHLWGVCPMFAYFCVVARIERRDSRLGRDEGILGSDAPSGAGAAAA